MKCTFFGHNDTLQEIQPKLESSLINLIENHNVNIFYVGNHGNFDVLVKKTLKKLKATYTNINYSIVLAYMPIERQKCNSEDYFYTIYPEGLENIPPKYAIIKRNRWMINNSDYVVTYVKRNTGGAARFKKISEKLGKTVINLADTDQNTKKRGNR